MLRQTVHNGKKAQVFIEYTIVIGVIVLAMLAMSMTIKRGTQAMIKSVADEIGNQYNADQRFDERGHLEYSYTSTRSTIDKTTNEFIGDTTYTYDDTVTTISNASMNLGFTEEN